MRKKTPGPRQNWEGVKEGNGKPGRELRGELSLVLGYKANQYCHQNVRSEKQNGLAEDLNIDTQIVSFVP